MNAVFEDPAGAACVPEWRNVLPGDSVPQCGDTVYGSDGTALRLIPIPAAANEKTGEGCVYRDDCGGCIKVFYPEKRTELKFRKIEMMLRKAEVLRHQAGALWRRLAWPVGRIYADAACRMPIGYRMRYFGRTEKLHDTIGRLSETAAAKAAVSVSEIVCFAEQAGFRLADALSSRNIRICEETGEAFAIDLDSIEFACGGILFERSVGHDMEFAPERLTESAPEYYTPQEDVWLLQRLLFMMLLNGCTPYMRLHSEGWRTDEINGAYAFPRGIEIKSRYELPLGRDGRYFQAMDRLPAALREAFYHAFSGDGRCFSAENRRSASDWVQIMKAYAARTERLHQCAS